MYITFAPAEANKAEPTLALKPTGDITRKPKQRYQRPQNMTCVCVCQIVFTKDYATHNDFYCVFHQYISFVYVDDAETMGVLVEAFFASLVT